MAAHIEIRIGKDDQGTYHLIGKATGESKEECQTLVELAAKAFTDGRETYMRIKPESDTWTDFDTKETQHRGYVRFSFLDRPGPMHEQERFVSMPLSVT